MRAFLEIIFDWIFGCHHRHLSRVFTIDRQTYRVCFACGTRLRYSWSENDVTDQDGDAANAGVVRSSVHTRNKQIGSVARNLIWHFGGLTPKMLD
jgi:hypothetical protein